MASAMIFTSTSSPCLSSLSSSYPNRKQAITVSVSQFSSFEVSFLQLGFSQWNGLKKIPPISTSPHLLKIEMKRKRRDKVKGVYASLFGVGAPEALVIGVVALLVFGPKGLAEVARNLGKTLRAFQPTIRELQEVSREFKSTLEREIGIDDIPSATQNRYTSSATTTTSNPSQSTSSGDWQMKIDPNGSPSESASKAYSSEDYLKITEEQLKAASSVQRLEGEASPSKSQPEIQSLTTQERTTSTSTGESHSGIQINPPDAHEEATSTMPSPGKPENQT